MNDTIKLLGVSFIVILMIILFRANSISSKLWENFAWLTLARVNPYTAENESSANKSLDLFEKSVTVDVTNRDIKLGIGIVHTMLGDERSAVSSWQEGTINPQLLIAHGKSHFRNDKHNEALLYFRGSSTHEYQPNEGWFLAGQVCQLAFARPNSLSSFNQDFCHAYFTLNENNLIINNQFNHGDAWGWFKRLWGGYGGKYIVDGSRGKPSPSGLLSGKVKDQVGGYSQTMTLPEDIEVRFSAWVKGQGDNEINARILHILWQSEDGSPAGNQLMKSIPQNQDWVFVERTFTTPKALEGEFTFSPALLTGSGQVWVDDVRLIIFE